MSLLLTPLARASLDPRATADLRVLHTVIALLRSPETTSGDSGTASPLKNL